MRTVTAATRLVGVLGWPVGHSLSPQLHNAAFEALGVDFVSVGFAVREGAIGAALEGLRALSVCGASVTMPHKEAAARLASVATPLVERLGAANCLRLHGDTIEAHSTDGRGLLDALALGADFDPAGRSCVVLGAGGAARAAIAALVDAGAEVTIVVRDPARAARALEVGGGRAQLGPEAAVADAALVVNATPVGMANTPAAGQLAISSAGLLGAGQVVCDLVYEPRRTPLAEAAAAAGATLVPGLAVLVHQARHQLELWTGQPLLPSVLIEACRSMGEEC